MPAELVAPAANTTGGTARRRWAAARLPEPPDAVFCFNDLLAIGALRAAAERGLRVPEDLAVVGFDNTEESAYSLPSLTTIAPDKAAIAERAVEQIARQIAGGPDGTAATAEGGGDRHALPGWRCGRARSAHSRGRRPGSDRREQAVLPVHQIGHLGPHSSDPWASYSPSGV